MVRNCFPADLEIALSFLEYEVKLWELIDLRQKCIMWEIPTIEALIRIQEMNGEDFLACLPVKEEEIIEVEDDGESDNETHHHNNDDEDDEIVEFTFDLDPDDAAVRDEVLNGLKDAVRKVALMEVQATHSHQRLVTQHQQDKLDSFVTGRAAQVKYLLKKSVTKTVRSIQRMKYQ